MIYIPKHVALILICSISCALLTYLLTTCSRFLLEKQTNSQLVNKFSVFYGTQRLITVFTSAHHLSLSRARSIQGPYPEPDQSRVPTKTLYAPLLSPHMCYMPHPSHSSQSDHSNNIWWKVQIISSSLCSFLHSPVTSSLSGLNILLSTPFSNALSSVHYIDLQNVLKRPTYALWLNECNFIK